MVQLLRECEELPPAAPRPVADPASRAAGRRSTSATDRVAHSLLTALAAPAPHHHSKEYTQKYASAVSGSARYCCSVLILLYAGDRPVEMIVDIVIVNVGCNILNNMFILPY